MAGMEMPVVWVGARRTPARAAMKNPRIQPNWLMRLGEAPDMARRSGSSTTARSPKPVRVRVKKMRRATATAAATPMSSTSWYWMLMPAKLNWPEIMLDTERSVPGFQISVARPVRMTMRPRVTSTGRSAEAPWSRRMKTRSTMPPAKVAPSTSTMSKATSTGRPLATTSSQ